MHFPEIPRDWINEEIELLGETPGQLPDDKVQKGEARQAYSEQKRQQQGVQQRTNPPIGKEYKELFEISFERFVEEVNRERITPDSRNRLEMEDSGDTVTFYLTPIGIDKTYRTKIPKTEFSQFKRFFFDPLSKPSKRVM